MAEVLFGIGLGIALHRFIMALVLQDDPDTKCAYCRWTGKIKDRHNP